MQVLLYTRLWAYAALFRYWSGSGKEYRDTTLNQLLNIFFLKPCINIVRPHKSKYSVTELNMSYTESNFFLRKTSKEHKHKQVKDQLLIYGLKIYGKSQWLADTHCICLVRSVYYLISILKGKLPRAS